MAWNVKGSYVETCSCDLLKMAAIADSPKVMTAGHWKLGVFVDEEASEEQADMLVKVFTGQLGSPMAGLAPLVGEVPSVECEGKTGLSTPEFSWAA